MLTFGIRSSGTYATAASGNLLDERRVGRRRRGSLPARKFRTGVNVLAGAWAQSSVGYSTDQLGGCLSRLRTWQNTVPYTRMSFCVAVPMHDELLFTCFPDI